MPSHHGASPGKEIEKEGRVGGRQEGGTLRQEEASAQEGRIKGESRSLANSKKYSRVSRK